MARKSSESGSTAYKKIDDVLSSYEWYQQFKQRRMSQSDYLSQVLLHQQELLDKGLSEDQIHLSSRFSLNRDLFVANCLEALYHSHVIPTTSYPLDEFYAYAKVVESSFQHGGYFTYIFPEEAQLMFALTHILQPKAMLFLGSYYGYWAIWSIPALKKYNGKACLIDLDPNVLELSKKNMQQMDAHQYVDYVCDDAIEFCQQEKNQYDFIVLDAEGPKTGADPDLLDKAIYYPILSVSMDDLVSSGTVLFHNILLNNPIEDIYFENKIRDNFNQFKKLLPFIEQNFTHWSHYCSTEGVGVARFKRGTDK